MVLVILLEEDVHAGVLLRLLLPQDFLRKVVLLLLGLLRKVGLLRSVEDLHNLVLWLDVLLRCQDPLCDQLWGRWVRIKGPQLFLYVVG